MLNPKGSVLRDPVYGAVTGAPAPVQPGLCTDISSRSDSAVQFSLIADRAGFEALEQQWNDLFDRVARPCHVFQSFNFLWHWVDHYQRSSGTLSIVTAHQAGRLALAWPLLMNRGFGVKRLTWLGEPVAQYGDALVGNTADDAALLAQSWSYVTSLGADVIDLRNVRQDAAVCSLLQSAGSLCVSSSEAPYVAIDECHDGANGDAPWSRKTSSNHGRHLRRLKEIGTVDFVQCRSGPNIIGLIDDALRMKRLWLQRRGAFSTAFSSLRLDRFLHAVAADPVRSLRVRSSGLCLNGKPIAVDLSFECKGQLLGFVLSHDEKYAKQGAGMVVACHSILSAFKEGYSRFDCLAPADPYKKRLTDRSIAVNSWATPLSIGGTVYSRLWLALLRPCARTIARILPRHAGLIASRVLAFFSKD